jgi:two-component system nitrogen regulation sensor histidine kinase NtrY
VSTPGPDEIRALSNAFNDDHRSAGAAGSLANRQSGRAETRRQFIETVLSASAPALSAWLPGPHLGALVFIAAVTCSAGGRHLLGLDLISRAQFDIQSSRQFWEDVQTLRSRGVDLVRDGGNAHLQVGADHVAEGLVLTAHHSPEAAIAQRRLEGTSLDASLREIKNPRPRIQRCRPERIEAQNRRRSPASLETFDRCTETIIRQVGDIGRMVDLSTRILAPQFETTI